MISLEIADPPVGKRQRHKLQQLLLKPLCVVLPTTHVIHDFLEPVRLAARIQDGTHNIRAAIEILPQLRQGECSAAADGAECMTASAERPLDVWTAAVCFAM